MSSILNFGSLNLDMVYSVEHIVVPGETIASSDIRQFCGGKGLNQSVALARAGANVYHAGKVGRDGAPLLAVLRENQIHCDYLRQTEGKSGHAVIQVEQSGQNSIILYQGANGEIDQGMIDEVLSSFGAGDTLVTQNEISQAAYLLQQGHAKGMQVVWNPSPINASILHYDLRTVDCLVVNELEGEMFSGQQGHEAIAKTLLSDYPHLKILLTVGKRGAYYYDRTGMLHHGIFPVQVTDTTGAGDTFLGYFTALTASGMPAENALRYASAASALAVSKAGAVPSIPSFAEVEVFLRQQ